MRLLQRSEIDCTGGVFAGKEKIGAFKDWLTQSKGSYI
jgi:hypothetical protein